MSVKVAVIYYSATGGVHALAGAVAEGATAAGAEVRLRRVADLPPAGSAPPDPDRPAPADIAAVAEATLGDLEWADGYAFGSPTRFGTPAAPLKHFLDQTVDLWQAGRLADKPVTAFTSAYHQHGGNEATILSLSNVFYHWGSVIVPPGFTDPAVAAAGGNPYGTSLVVAQPRNNSTATALAAARHQGRRLTMIAERLTRARLAPAVPETRAS